MPPVVAREESPTGNADPGNFREAFYIGTSCGWGCLVRQCSSDPIHLPCNLGDPGPWHRQTDFQAEDNTFHNQPIEGMTNHDDDMGGVEYHANESLLDFLRQAMKAAKARAAEHECKITKIVPIFPSTWTNQMQKYYSGCLETVWGLEAQIVYESEAIANFVVSRTHMGKKGSMPMIVLNLDEYVLNISTLNVESHGSDPAGFHLFNDQNDVSVNSGIHHHEALVKTGIRTYIERNILPSEQKAIFKNFMKSYNRNCGGIAMANGDSFNICAASGAGRHHMISFSDESSRMMFDTCFSDVFTQLNTFLDGVAARGEPGKTEVVLAGTGFRNASIRKKVKQQVKDRGFVLNNAYKLRDTKQPSSVLLGAAFAVSNAVTVETFMKTACFAIRGARSRPSSGIIIWSDGESKTARIYVSKKSEKLIMCHPTSKVTEEASLDKWSSYRFSKLSLPRGDLEVHMEFQISPTSGYSVNVYYKHLRAGASEGGEASLIRRCPIYLDYGSRLCFEDIDKSSALNGADQATMLSEKNDKLASIKDEETKAQILARTGYRGGGSEAAGAPATRHNM